MPAHVVSLEQQVRDFLRDKYQKAGNIYLGIPHRLDRPVSGVVVFSRNSKCAARLAEQFQLRTVQKTYWAITQRPPIPAEGTLVDWLAKIPDEARGVIATESTPGAKLARLTYRTLAQVDDRALLEIELHTGRMHQIRIQLASRGWPIIGDTTYASDAPAEHTPAAIFLHARCLQLKHPIRYDDLTLIAPLPNHWPIEFTGADAD